MREGLRGRQRGAAAVSLDRLHNFVTWIWAFPNLREPAAPPLGQPKSSAGLRARGRGHRVCAKKRGQLGMSWEPDTVALTPTPVPRLPRCAAQGRRTSERKRPPGAAAPRFARLGLLLVANAGIGSQQLLNNHTGFTNHSEGCITIPPIAGPDGLGLSKSQASYRCAITPSTKFIFQTSGSNVQALLRRVPGLCWLRVESHVCIRGIYIT